MDFQNRNYFPPLASASHCLRNELFAAPANGFPFLSMALSAHADAAAAPLESVSHFLMEAALAAPARGLPSRFGERRTGLGYPFDGLQRHRNFGIL